MEQSRNSNDFLLNYRNISLKIKKRFLRKPNIAEASDDFNKLARTLSDCEAWPQAGLCCLAVARCEQSLSNPITEVASMTEAARKFMKAEMLNQSLLCPNYNEHMVTAISCYQLAIKLYKEQNKPALAASLALELSQDLCSLGKHSEALTYLLEASGLLSNSPSDYLTCLSQIASCKIELGDLDGSLEVFTQISSLIKEYEDEQSLCGAYSDILSRSEVCSLLLLLTLQPLPQQMKPNHVLLIEKYSWTALESQTPEVPYDDPELVVLLQSLVLACQTRDLDALSSLSHHLSSKLSGQALHLLYVLLTEMNRS